MLETLKFGYIARGKRRYFPLRRAFAYLDILIAEQNNKQ
jgi:hypothetical protein